RLRCPQSAARRGRESRASRAAGRSGHRRRRCVPFLSWLGLHRDFALGLCLAGQNDVVGFIVGIESVLHLLLDLAGSHPHLAHAAGADAAREFDPDAELLREFRMVCFGGLSPRWRSTWILADLLLLENVTNGPV